MQLAFSPGIVLSVLAATAVSAVVFFGSKRSLQLAETFPEMLRIPVVGRLVR